MEEKVLEIIKNLFELDYIDENCSQATCKKWDSLGHLNLVIELENEFDISIEPDEIAEMDSYEAVIRILKTKFI